MYKSDDNGAVERIVKDLGDIFNLNVLERNKSRKYVYPRWAFWFMLKSNGYSIRKISKETEFDRKSVRNGINSFRDLVIQGDSYATECYNKIKNYAKVKRKKESR